MGEKKSKENQEQAGEKDNTMDYGFIFIIKRLHANYNPSAFLK